MVYRLKKNHSLLMHIDSYAVFYPDFFLSEEQKSLLGGEQMYGIKCKNFNSRVGGSEINFRGDQMGSVRALLAE